MSEFLNGQQPYRIAEALRYDYRHGLLTRDQIARLEAIGFKWAPRSRKGRNLSIARPDLAEYWHPTKNGDLTPEDVTVGSNKKVWWRHWHEGTRTWHEWEESIRHRAEARRPCPYCANKRVLLGYNDLATTYPEIARRWHPTKNGNLTPRDVLEGSNKRVWWICAGCGDEFEARICDISHTSKPLCARCKSLSFRANRKPVVKVEDGSCYSSAKLAASYVSSSPSGYKMIIEAANTGRAAYGYHWRYVTEEEIAAHKAGEDSDGQGKE